MKQKRGRICLQFDGSQLFKNGVNDATLIWFYLKLVAKSSNISIH